MIGRVRPWMLSAALFVVAVLAAVGIVLGAFTLVQTRDRAAEIAQVVRDRTTAVVRARHDDCEAANRVLAALREEVMAGKRTDPLLFRLVPSLDNAEVRALLRTRRQRELRAFASRDCDSYALQAVPPAQRSHYRLP